MILAFTADDQLWHCRTQFLFMNLNNRFSSVVGQTGRRQAITLGRRCLHLGVIAEENGLYDRKTTRPTVQGATFSMRGQLCHGHYLSHYVMEGRGRR